MAQPPLRSIEADILYLIWKRKTLGDGTAMTVRDLHKALAQHKGRKIGGVSAQVIKKALQALKTRTGEFLEISTVSKEGSGPRPAGYRLAAGKIMTEPSNAAIVMALYNYPEHTPPDRKRLIEYIAERGLGSEGSSTSGDRSEIEELIGACIEGKYIFEDRQSGRLSTTSRVDEELGFLEALAGEANEKDPGENRW
jgi:hypothetical protein